MDTKLTQEFLHQIESAERWAAEQQRVNFCAMVDELDKQISDAVYDPTLNCVKRMVVMPEDVRTSRVRDIEYALNNEPVTKEQASALLDELAELGADIQSDPPEFGGAEWFRSIEPLEY